MDLNQSDLYLDRRHFPGRPFSLSQIIAASMVVLPATIRNPARVIERT
jgi:hypothetical protein